uniref:DUF3755 family protein n=1 Tax=Oryza glumipatula TaxID=40148 RepID=A0A0D9ZSB3_9ORYZ
MAADSSMGFHQGITASMYNHHMLSFQSNSDLGGGTGAAAGMVMAPRSMNGTSSSAGLFVSPNTGVLGNASVAGPSRSSSGDAFSSTVAPKYKFVTGSPSDWNDRELNTLKEGLVRYAREPNIMKYIKIAAMLPNRTVRDVALRCWWATSKDRRKKPDGFYTGKKIRDMKPIQDKMVASASMANFHLAPANTVTPFSISMQHTNQQCQCNTASPGRKQSFTQPNRHKYRNIQDGREHGSLFSDKQQLQKYFKQNERDAWYHGPDAPIASASKRRPSEFTSSAGQNGSFVWRNANLSYEARTAKLV